MTDQPKPPPPADPGGLQFDRAEAPIAETGDGCTACRKPFGESYYLVGQQRICPACRDSVQQSLASGSKGGRLIKATILGLLAALTSGALWAFIIIQFDIVIGLVAIGLGLLIGAAVRKGSEGRGGRGYQVLAVSLTYLGIAVGYSGALIPMAMKSNPAIAPENSPAAPGSPAASPAAAPAPAPPEQPPVSAGGCLVSLFILAGIGLASPVLIAKESPITFLILGFALWEAWKLNRGISVQMTGPYRIGPATSPESKPGG